MLMESSCLVVSVNVVRKGKIQAIRYARENDVPMLGVCLGMQLTCIEFARHILHLDGANSAELDPNTKYPIIDIMRDQIDIEDMVVLLVLVFTHVS